MGSRDIFLIPSQKIKGFLKYTGSMVILLLETIFWIFIPPYRRKQISEQMYKVGVSSLPIVLLTSLFTGMVLALQSAYQMQRISAQMYRPCADGPCCCRQGRGRYNS